MIFDNVYWKNQNGTENLKCRCGTWKQHWINYTNGTWPTRCSASDCYNEPTLGGHVHMVNDRKVYIVPLCDKCNKRTDEFMLNMTIANPVSSNIAETCGKGNPYN